MSTTVTQSCGNNSIGMSGSYDAYGFDLTDTAFYSTTLTQTTVRFISDSGSQTATIGCNVYDDTGGLISSFDTSQTVTFNASSSTQLTFNGSTALTSNGGYIMFTYNNNNLRIVVGDSTISSPCSPTETSMPIARISGSTVTSITNNYTTGTVTFSGSSPGAASQLLPPPVAWI